MLFNPGLMEQPPFLPLPPGLSGNLYTLVYLEPPNTPMVYLEPPLSHGLPGAPTIPWSTWSLSTPWSTWSPLHPSPPGALQYPLVYQEPPLSHGLHGAPLFPGLPDLRAPRLPPWSTWLFKEEIKSNIFSPGICAILR